MDEAMFSTTQTHLTYLEVEIKNITKIFEIAWTTVTWRNLTKPLHPALGARLYMTYNSSRTATIPRAVDPVPSAVLGRLLPPNLRQEQVHWRRKHAR